MESTPRSPASMAPDVARMAARFSALGSEQRLAVLTTLVRAGPDGLSIGALGERAGVSGSTLTHHLKLLAGAGLIAQTRQGRSVICVAAAYETVRMLSEFLLSECCADAGHGQGQTGADHRHD